MKQFLHNIDKKEHAKIAFILFISIWFLINIIQAITTGLAHDEAYYWLYSKNLNWGYFDHPPMIAFIIRIGTLFSDHELAVRIVPVILGTMSMAILYFLTPRASEKISLFIALCFSVLIIQSHVGGLLAIPDIPLIFFFILFLYVYKIYLDNDSFLLALLLGVISACMLYSKYHGLLVLIFTLISNIKIVKRRSFWLIPVIISLLMLPHLFWQINHDFPTFEYHLISRSKPYTIGNTINYVVSQFLIAGPLVSIIFIYHGFKSKPANQFEKTLQYIMIGFLAFFFLSSFKGHVEAHWTAIAYVAMFILAFKSIIESKTATRWVYILFIPSIILVIFIRISLVHNIFHFKTNVPHEFLNWKEWAGEIKNVAEERDVVFMNTFQRPAKYTYYTGRFSTSLNTYNYRKNQFDIWFFEDSLQNKNVLLIHAEYPEDTIKTCTGEAYPFKKLDHFKSYFNIPVRLQVNKISGIVGFKKSLHASIYNPRNSKVEFTTDSLYNSILQYNFYRSGELYSYDTCYVFTNEVIPSHHSMDLDIQVKLPQEAGKYQMVISIKTHELAPALNSGIIPVRIKN